jgi:MFS family permease
MNWILSTLQASIAFFDAWMTSLYDVLMLDPISYQNGAIWTTVSKIYDALMGPAVSILIIGFYIALIHDSGEFIKTRHFGSVVWTFILLCITASLLQGGKYILLLIFWCFKEILQTVTGPDGTNFLNLSWVELPKQVKLATSGLGATKATLFFIVVLIFALVIMVCSFTIIMVVYGRLFNIYLHLAVAPLALACGAAGPLRGTFASYLRSFVGVCLQGVVIVIVCMVFSAFANNFDFNTVQTSDQQIVELKEDMTEEEFQEWWEQWGMDNKELEAKKAEVLWTYLSQMLFLYLIMAGMIKGADNFIHQKLNL